MKIVGKCPRCRIGSMVIEPDEPVYCINCSYTPPDNNHGLEWDVIANRYIPIVRVRPVKGKGNHSRLAKYG